MRVQDYIFADVAGIDISGEVLPQHENEGGWRPERAEDWAFVAEAWGERKLIEYKDSTNGRTQEQVENRIREIKEYGFMKNLRVGTKYEEWNLMKRIEEMLTEPYTPKWCAGVPEERTWEEEEYDRENYNWWYENCRDMFPERQLDVQSKLWEMDRCWKKERLSSAYADLAAYKLYICDNWYDKATQITTNQDGRVFEGIYQAWYYAYTSGGRRWEAWYEPSAPKLAMPEGAGTPTLMGLFYVGGGRQNVRKYQLKTMAPEEITLSFLRSMAPEAYEEEVVVRLDVARLIVPISMRTNLN